MPTKDANGEEIAKSQKKKLEKLYAAHVKKYEKEQASSAEPSRQGSNATESKDCDGYPGNPVPEVKDLAMEDAAEKLTDEIEKERIEMEKATPLFRVVMGSFGNRQGFEMTSTGPFTHILSF